MQIRKLINGGVCLANDAKRSHRGDIEHSEDGVNIVGENGCHENDDFTCVTSPQQVPDPYEMPDPDTRENDPHLLSSDYTNLLLSGKKKLSWFGHVCHHDTC